MQKSLVVAALLSVACAAPALAGATPCPEISTTAPDLVTAGDELKVIAEVKGGDPNITPTYNWTVSDGSISSGQGTSVITVETKEAVGGFITATVEIGGYDRECDSASSVTTSIEAKSEQEPAPEKPPR